MNKTKIFYPVGIENIWHQSADGNRRYRLDPIEKIVHLKDTLATEPEFEIIEANDGETKSWSLVHTPAYISALITGSPKSLAESSGIMWQESLPQAYANSTKAMILACEEAMSEDFAITLGKGGHHTVADRGYGFGPVNEAVIAIKFLQKQNPNLKIAVLDTDVHIGNGWQKLLGGNLQVLLVDIWSKTIPKWELSEAADNVFSVKVNDASEYIPKLSEGLERIRRFQPDLLIYHCGLDVLDSDRMDGINGFSESKLLEREKVIAEFVRTHQLAIALVTGGGYIDHTDEQKAKKDFQHLIKLYKDVILIFNQELKPN